MQLAIDHARDNRRDLRALVETHDGQLKDLRRDLGAAEVKATNVNRTVCKCDLAVEADNECLEDLAAENRRLSEMATALQVRADQQDQHIAQLRTAVEAGSGRIDDLAIENRRLSDLNVELHAHVERQDPNVAELRTAVEAGSGRFDGLTAENRRFSEAATALQAHVEQQDQHVAKLRNAVGAAITRIDNLVAENGRLSDAAERKDRRTVELSASRDNWKMLSYFLIGAFVAFFSFFTCTKSARCFLFHLFEYWNHSFTYSRLTCHFPLQME